MKSKYLVVALLSAVLATMAACQEAAEVALNNLAETIVNDTDDIKEDQWTYYTFTIHDDGSSGGVIRIVGRHLSGPALDFLVMQRAEYDRLLPILKSLGRAEYTYQPALSRMNMSGDFDTGWVQIPNGEYVLLIDNSPNFDAGPAWNFQEDTARYSVEVKATDVRK